MKPILVEGVSINDPDRCYVIAEIGHNHQGDVEKAKEMFKVAKWCGVDAVKLQKRDNRALYTDELYNAPYASENSFGDTYGRHREALEFGRDEYRELQAYAREIGVAFFATAFDFESVDFLADLDMPAFKIASGDLKNTPLQKHIAQVGKPVLLSTGGGTLEDVKRAYHTIMPINPQLCIMQCTASYPAQVEDLNLRVITRYRTQFPDTVIGFSDHQNGIAMAVAGYLLGALVIEKHFTLNRALKGTDHSYSLEPIGMQKLVRDLRRVPLALGSDEKTPLDCEQKPLHKMGKKLVAAHALGAGRVLGPGDVSIRSPGEGLAPFELDNVLGKTVIRDLKQDENITFEILK
ncbi:MAG: N-acetylneuraminate synthase family protein [Thermodesulfobacteriota bacterium]|nr:N-acetylneuraminate synthase family protein [Thermodesulfobacteriota bacterium]